MTRTRDMSCEQVRQQAYHYRRTELIRAETAAIDAHVESCGTCCDYYMRLGILLGAASSWETIEVATRADDLFAGIAARLASQAEPTSAEPAFDEETFSSPYEGSEKITYANASMQWVPAVIGLATGILLTLGVLRVLQSGDDARPAPTDDGERVTEQPADLDDAPVSPKNGPSTTLIAKRERGLGFEAREMPAERIEASSRYVDVEERARAKPPTFSVETSVKTQPDLVKGQNRLPPDLERLRMRAERSMKRGNHHDAVRYYRGLLERLPPMHPIAASVHLDLAHIYLHRLNSPGRAAPFLRTFVERWPADVASPTARRELCKIFEQTGGPDPGCEVQP